MAFYTFHSFTAAGAPVALHAAEFRGDSAATDHAEKVLRQHGTATEVLVFSDDRHVVARTKAPSAY